MRKKSITFYKVALTISTFVAIVTLVYALRYFFGNPITAETLQKANAVIPEGVNADEYAASLCKIYAIYYFISFAFSVTHAIVCDITTKKFTKGLVISTLVLGILSTSIFGIVAAILGLIAIKKEEKPLSEIEENLSYLKESKFSKFIIKIGRIFYAVPMLFKKIGIGFAKFIANIAIKIKEAVVNVFQLLFTKKGSWKTKVSYVFMGFGNIVRGQVLKGLLFFVFEVVFIGYMVLYGGYWLGKFDNLGDAAQIRVYDEVLDTYAYVAGDDSFKILLYGLLTIIFIIAFIVTWYMNIMQCKICDEIERSGKKVKSGKDDLRSLVDDQFHKTLLSLPLLGIFLFTVLPIIFMILVAFTNYDAAHDGYSNLFTWVGLDNFNDLITWKTGGTQTQYAFGEILSWTLIWAFFATFTNYFLGMLVAIMINKKGIKMKKLWRGVLVLTIAIPQFISLLYVSKLFAKSGLVNGFLLKLGIIDTAIDFWGTTGWARVLVILINIWIGIPYLMLISTGILMNIPQDLYESAKIDGANAWQQYMRITLPYMLFVTGPYLLTSFIGNINNFNVIYLLTGGEPTNPKLLTSGGSAGDTDILITWLFKIAIGTESNYKFASVIGILIFLVVAILSLVVFNLLPSTRNEEDYS